VVQEAVTGFLYAWFDAAHHIHFSQVNWPISARGNERSVTLISAMLTCDTDD